MSYKQKFSLVPTVSRPADPIVEFDQKIRSFPHSHLPAISVISSYSRTDACFRRRLVRPPAALSDLNRSIPDLKSCTPTRIHLDDRCTTLSDSVSRNCAQDLQAGNAALPVSRLPEALPSVGGLGVSVLQKLAARPCGLHPSVTGFAAARLAEPLTPTTLTYRICR